MRQNGVEAHLGVGEKLDVPDQAYDAAMAFETLEHSLYPVAFLEGIIRVARYKIILSIPEHARLFILVSGDFGSGKNTCSNFAPGTYFD